MTPTRASGLLLHPTSFPNDYGIGSLGREALEWLSWLQSAGQKLWQILPLGHTGYGDSPYQCFSAHAGNPLLVSLELLRDEGWLPPEVLTGAPDFSRDEVDYGLVYEWKWTALRAAHRGFRERATGLQQGEFREFRAQHAAWLADYALFMALKDEHGGSPWTTWAPELVRREPAALEAARERLSLQVELYEWVQHVFFQQWAAVRAVARERDITIIGDIPIFVAHDSSDVWARQDLFALEPDGSPSVVAGVPPDYFSATGQLWGNPHYRWDRMEADGFEWWLARFASTFGLVDVVRVDHFRGFDAYWEIPGGAPTAERGRWVGAPGEALFRAVRARFGELPVIAEDLGVITPAVERLRDGFDLPGMKILQFAFYDGPNDPFLPHTYRENCVVYTGTHDNDTTVGWWDSEPEEVRAKVRAYFGIEGSDIAWDLTRAGWRSRARMALAPLQDIPSLGTAARMNLPGRLGGNWAWRYRPEVLTDDLAARLRDLTRETGR